MPNNFPVVQNRGIKTVLLNSYIANVIGRNNTILKIFATSINTKSKQYIQLKRFILLYSVLLLE